MSDTVLVINAGSSSIKFELFAVRQGDTLERLFEGQLDGIGTSHPRLRAKDHEGAGLVDRMLGADEARGVAQAQAVLGEWLIGQMAGVTPIAVGHRVVHGGITHSAPSLVDDALLADLDRLIPLAPLHQPANLLPIRTIRRRWPELPQVACFDTAFHRSHPDVADRYAVPDQLYRDGVRRYGFHGLSYEHVVGRLPELAPEIARGRVIVAHLGSGASMCAVVDGRSVDSTMGFTAVDGLPMGTRTGAIDPGVILYLIAERKMDARHVEHFLYHDCGLRGLSGVSNDVRDLLASDAPSAQLALDYFAYRAAFYVGGLTAVMGGIDGLVFTAGIGEHAAWVRADVCQRCAWLGVTLDEQRNAGHGPKITTDDSRLPVYVVPTDEELVIARHTLRVLRRQRETAT